MDFGGMDVLDYRAGSGLLGIYCARFGAKEVVSHNETEKEFERALENSMVNGIFITPATKTELEITSAQSFDMVLCQKISPKTARDDIHFLSKLIGPNGCAILTGWEAKQHQFVRGIIEEFFTVKILDDLNGCPIMKVVK
jgi:predicted nicotinamide N-methyase